MGEAAQRDLPARRLFYAKLGSMSEALLDFLIELAEDPLQARAFRAQPESLLAGRGLHEDERQALLTSNALRLRTLLALPPEHDLLLLAWRGLLEAAEAAGETQPSAPPAKEPQS